MPIIKENRAPISAPILGDGSDGNVTISSNTTLSREMFYNTLTVNSGVTLNTAGYRVCVKGILTNYGTIANNGGNGSGMNGGQDVSNIYGANTTTHNGGNGSSGGSNGSAPTSSVSTALPSPSCRGGAGGNSGTGFNGGAAGTVSSTVPSGARIFGPTIINISYFRTTAWNIGTSGGGGAAGGSGVGGGGGARGGLVLIHANTIANFGNIEAKGGNGANASGSGGAGGGGGGGGGIIILVARAINDFGTVTAAGGSGGSGIGSGFSGTAGNSGEVYRITSI